MYYIRVMYLTIIIFIKIINFINRYLSDIIIAVNIAARLQEVVKFLGYTCNMTLQQPLSDFLNY